MTSSFDNETGIIGPVTVISRPVPIYKDIRQAPIRHHYKKRRPQRRRVKITAPTTSIKCPDCGAPVRILPVNVSKCTNIGGEFQTSVHCLQAGCHYSIVSKKTAKELRKYGL